MVDLPNSNIISENEAVLIDQTLLHFNAINSWPPANSFMELHLFFGPNAPQNYVVYEGISIYPTVPVVFPGFNNIPIETTAVEVEGSHVLQEVEGILIVSEVEFSTDTESMDYDDNYFEVDLPLDDFNSLTI